MALERIELRLLRLPYVHYFETSLGREKEREFILVKVFSQGETGYGEVAASRAPLYSYETVGTAWHVLTEFFIPLLFRQKIEDPEEFAAAVRKYRGHPMARAGLELALWDLKARKLNQPLFKLYGGVYEKIPAGVSIGIQDSVEELIARVGDFLQQGYQRIKLKIKPGWDINVCQAVRDHFPDILLQVDANGAYSRETKAGLKALDEFNLLMIEQPFPPYDLWDHSLFQKEMNTPLCLDESIYDFSAARSAVEMDSCRVINIKVGRVGGIVEARQIHDFCQEKGLPVWCGGMLESGIGRAHNLHLASLPNFKFPHDLSASRRYYQVDIVEPEITLEPGGKIKVPQDPGIGVTPREKMIESLTLKKEVLLPEKCS